ncbi:MAG: LPS export ABC transporter periplasmic protein LptC [Bacteroidota bacterium]
MQTRLHIVKSAMVTLVAIALFACEGNYSNVKRLSMKDNLPVSEGKNVKLVYTDSGKVVANLITPRLLDYSNFEFGYQEFPDGLEVQFFEDGEMSTVKADFAMRYPETGIVDLRNNVELVTADGNTLNADQLYWDQQNKWVFTDQPYRITFNDGSYNDGASFDANEDFTVFLSRKNDGIQIIDQQKSEELNVQ